MALLDVNALTLEEIEMMEEHTGLLIEELMTVPKGQKRPSTKVLICFVWVLKHREDPLFTIEKARQLTMDEMTELINDQDVEPTAGEKRRTKKPATPDPSGAVTANV